MSASASLCEVCDIREGRDARRGGGGGGGGGGGTFVASSDTNLAAPLLSMVICSLFAKTTRRVVVHAFQHYLGLKLHPNCGGGPGPGPGERRASCICVCSYT